MYRIYQMLRQQLLYVLLCIRIAEELCRDALVFEAFSSGYEKYESLDPTSILYQSRQYVEFTN